MIQTLRLQNFKAIRDVEVGLERLTVFVGPNGSGKTSILQGLELLVGVRFDRRFGGLNKMIFSKGYRDKYSKELGLNLFCTTAEGSVHLHVEPDHNSFVSSNSWSSPPEDVVLSIKAKATHAPVEEWEDLKDHSQVVRSLGRVELIRFDPTQMADPSSGVGNHLRPNGSNLASFLTFRALNQPDEFANIQRQLSEIIPTIKRIRFDRSQSSRTIKQSDAKGNSMPPRIVKTTADEMIFDLKNGVSISARAASEGTLLVLGLVAILNNNNQDRPNLILFDDLDRGLHPLAQRDVIALLRKVLEQQPDLQIVATTHSPYLVDCLRAEEVRMTTLNDDGTVACGRLVDHPKFEQWKNEMAPGEMWSMFGEKWVSQSTAQPVETL